MLIRKPPLDMLYINRPATIMKTPSIVALSFFFGLFLVPTKSVVCNDSAKVIIVGAGPAGIAAASRLYENGFTDILILEAEDRIGGRIYTTTFEGATIDLGAEFCHGEKNNIVYELANKYNLLRPAKLEEKFVYSSNYPHYSGRRNANQRFISNVYKQLDDMYENSAELTEENMSIGDYLTERFEEEILDRYKRNKSRSKLSKEVFDYFMSSLAAYEGAFSLFNVSCLSSYEECEGNQQQVWKRGGYKTILEVLMNKYPNPRREMPIKSKTLLNKEVSKIIWDYTDREHYDYVIVKCLDGSIYTADHVIFTPSLGVLKSCHEDMFDPELPEEKVTAINKLGMGSVSKIFLHFPHKWWPDTLGLAFRIILSEEDKNEILEKFSHGPIKNGRSWLQDVSDFTALQPNSSLLVAWVGGELAAEVEEMDDDLIIEGIGYILRKSLADMYPDFTEPDELTRNNWYSNPHFQGTYSFETVESYEESEKEGIPLQEVLSQPLTSSDGKVDVMFAGEATNPIHFSMVHGAIETGFREAQRIIDLYS